MQRHIDDKLTYRRVDTKNDRERTTTTYCIVYCNRTDSDMSAYKRYKVVELRKMCVDRHISTEHCRNKRDLIELLEQDDA